MTRYLMSKSGSGSIFPARIVGPDAAEHFRPVVVIDPEDREQVERLLSLFADALNWGPHNIQRESYREPLQAALRELANPTPPKPEEPTGLGAVVEDADGNRWVRTAKPEWISWDIRHQWRDITAVRVLSEGVSS